MKIFSTIFLYVLKQKDTFTGPYFENSCRPVLIPNAVIRKLPNSLKNSNQLHIFKYIKYQPTI